MTLFILHFRIRKDMTYECLVKMPLAGQFTALPSCVSRDAGDAAWPGWTCQGLSLSPLSGLSWLLARSVLRHHKTSWTGESLWTNQRPGLSLTGQSGARDQPQPDDDHPGSQVSRFLHWWLICPLDRQTPLPCP